MNAKKAPREALAKAIENLPNDHVVTLNDVIYAGWIRDVLFRLDLLERANAGLGSRLNVGAQEHGCHHAPGRRPAPVEIQFVTGTEVAA